MSRPRAIEPAPRRLDPAIVELVKALARQAAREDHASQESAELNDVSRAIGRP